MTWFGVSSTWSRAQGTSGKPGYAWDYQVDILGYKYYMIDIMAAICLEQMKKLPAHLERRRYIQSQYNEKLNERMIRPPHSDTVQYYIARIPEYRSYAPDKSGGITASRDGLIDYLGSKNIHTSVHFKPLHKYGILRQTNYRDYPVADNIWESLISLPCHPAMTDEDIDYVIYWVNKYFEE
jgi:perosamine synthetase